MRNTLAIDGIESQKSLELDTYIQPFKQQLLKWVGNKQRFAHEIISFFPESFNRYYEPFLGSGAVLGTLAPKDAFASDAFEPLMDIWLCLKEDPEALKTWYEDRWKLISKHGKKKAYEEVKKSYNFSPNGADFVFLTRSCYGGVVRFRKQDGYMSTPCGAHNPINPESFSNRVNVWHERLKNVDFGHVDYQETMLSATKGDLIYCDPPYSYSQGILYGAQSFNLERLMEIITICKSKGVYVALSIDGSKKSGNHICNIPVPEGVFEREVLVNCGRSMLKRFQMEGKTLESEEVSDRLLLTY